MFTPKKSAKIFWFISVICLIGIVSPVISVEAATLIIGSHTCKPGESLTIPLTLDTEGEEISIFSADIHIENGIFQISDATVGPAATASGKTTRSHKVDDDTYRILVLSQENSNPIEDGVVCEIILDTEEGITPHMLSLSVESASASDPRGNYVDISTIGYIILTDEYPACIIPSGSDITVFGSAGNNSITVKSGSKVTCWNFPGENQINIQDGTVQCRVKRSGAMVSISSDSGMNIRIPATSVIQTIRFADGSSPLVITDGKVMLGGQQIMTTEEAVSSPDNGDDISYKFFQAQC